MAYYINSLCSLFCSTADTREWDSGVKINCQHWSANCCERTKSLHFSTMSNHSERMYLYLCIFQVGGSCYSKYYKLSRTILTDVNSSIFLPLMNKWVDAEHGFLVIILLIFIHSTRYLLFLNYLALIIIKNAIICTFERKYETRRGSFMSAKKLLIK